MNHPSVAQPQSIASIELEDHATFLRSLARRLVKDASSADDLAQETLIAAVSSKTRRGDLANSEARPWMARVLRRKAANQWRTDSRRSARENVAAKREAVGSTFDSIAQIDLAERLLGHVRDLDPAVQDAIMARFYRGVSLKDVANEAGVPVTTMQSRISRGLGEIRQKLDAEEPGGRSAWLGGLAAFGGVGSGTKAGAGTAIAAGGRASAGWVAGAVASTAALVGAAVFWIAPPGLKSELQAAEPTTHQASGESVTGETNKTVTRPNRSATLAEVESATDPDGARVELPLTTAEITTELADASTGTVYYLDDEGVEQPSVGTVVQWSTERADSPPQTLSGLGYGGDSLSAPVENDTPTGHSAVTNSSGEFQLDAVLDATRLNIKVASDDRFREVKWSGTGADWASAEPPIALTRIPHGALLGKVVDYAGKPLPEVPISLSEEAAGVEYDVVTDSEGAFELPRFPAKYPRAILREAIQLPGHVVVGHEEPEKLGRGGWRPLTVVLARTGSVRVAFPKNRTSSRELTLSVSPIDPLQIRPRFQRLKVEATAGADGVALFEGAPIGPALTLQVAESFFAYDYQLDGVAQSSRQLIGEEIPSTWSRIRVPASGTLDLELPRGTSAVLNVAVVRTDGTHVDRASVMAFGNPKTGEAMDMLLFRGKAGADGKAQVMIPSLNENGPILLIANDSARSRESRGERRVPFGAAFWDPSSGTSEEIVLRTELAPSGMGRIVLPAAAKDGELDKTKVLVTILAPSTVSEVPFPLVRQEFSSRNIDAKGQFEFMTMRGCRYRIDAQHEGLGDVSVDVEFDAEPSPVEIRFQAPIDLAQVTFRLEAPGGDKAQRTLIYGTSPDSYQYLQFPGDSSAMTLHLPPGKLWLAASGSQPGTKLLAPAAGYYTVAKGSSKVTMFLRPKVIASGSLQAASNRGEVLYLQLISEGRSDPLYVGVGQPNHTTPWIETDPYGRFRCECPTGNFTAWVGTREELRAEQPRRRVPVTVTEEGLIPAKL